MFRCSEAICRTRDRGPMVLARTMWLHPGKSGSSPPGCKPNGKVRGFGRRCNPLNSVAACYNPDHPALLADSYRCLQELCGTWGHPRNPSSLYSRRIWGTAILGTSWFDYHISTRFPSHTNSKRHPQTGRATPKKLQYARIRAKLADS